MPSKFRDLDQVIFGSFFPNYYFARLNTLYDARHIPYEIGRTHICLQSTPFVWNRVTDWRCCRTSPFAGPDLDSTGTCRNPCQPNFPAYFGPEDEQRVFSGNKTGLKHFCFFFEVSSGCLRWTQRRQQNLFSQVRFPNVRQENPLFDFMSLKRQKPLFIVRSSTDGNGMP